MAYVRTSRSRGKEYRQVVESYREGGKVKQRVLVHIGRFETPEEAAEWYERVKMSCAAERYRREAAAKQAERERRVRWRTEYDLPVPEKLTRPTWSEAKLLADAEKFDRRDAEHARKAKILRELLASGKLKPDTPDTPEMREERERRREEELARLRELESRVRPPL